MTAHHALLRQSVAFRYKPRVTADQIAQITAVRAVDNRCPHMGFPLALPLLRGVLDAAMSVYLDRFLNTPPARIPQPDGSGVAAEILAELPELLDRQQQVTGAGELVARYLAAAGDDRALLAALGRMLLREDRESTRGRRWRPPSASTSCCAGRPRGRTS